MNKKTKSQKVAEAMLRNLLKGKSVLGMYKWVKEHSDYLVWFENYNQRAITEVMNQYGEVVALLNQSDSKEACVDCLELSIRTVFEMELNCR